MLALINHVTLMVGELELVLCVDWNTWRLTGASSCEPRSSYINLTSSVDVLSTTLTCTV